jgi:hypothetical protein
MPSVFVFGLFQNGGDIQDTKLPYKKAAQNYLFPISSEIFWL